MEGGFVIFLLVVVIVIDKIIKGMKDDELLKKNPKAWRAKKLVDEEVKRRKRESHAKIGMQIGRWFLPK